MARKRKNAESRKKWGRIGAPGSAKRKAHMKRIARKGRKKN